jgi:hypothetical protein
MKTKNGQNLPLRKKSASKKPRQSPDTKPKLKETGTISSRNADIKSQLSTLDSVPRVSGDESLTDISSTVVFQQPARSVNTYIHILTGLRLLGAINQIIATLSMESEKDFETKMKELSEEERSCFSDVLATYPDAQVFVDQSVGMEGMIRFISWMNTKPELRPMTLYFDSIQLKTAKIFELVVKLLSSNELQQQMANVSDSSQYCAVAEKLTNVGLLDLTKSWQRSVVVRTPESFTVRDPLVKHEKYNPKGISLLCVLHEITVAMERNTVFPAIVETFSYWLKIKHLNWMDDIACHYQQYSRLARGQSAIEKENDLKKAVFIEKYPSALLLSPVHQEAVARWLYASRCGSAADKETAQQYLRQSQASRNTAGRRTIHPADPKQLRQAYEDLIGYVKMFNRAAKDLKKDEDKVLAIFPDCEFLFFDLKTGEWKDEFYIQLKKPEKTHAASEVAVTFIARHSGLSETKISEVLQQTSRSAKP